ncbi:MAG TPA: MBOAT family protein, partial [Phycisphaerae bacterium]|nr:MBOAT family protein [Phycisphaerae bacterium]
ASRVYGVSWGRKAAYLLLFPGMNATGFCAGPSEVGPPVPGARYVANVLAGSVLLWGVARVVPPAHPIVEGWVGMVGCILLLHFGILQLIALAWQSAGYDAPLLMNQPILSVSVAEFWSFRWNTAFRHLSHQLLFRPVARRIGPRAATLATFAASGVLHDFVISFPAGKGFGLPTAYFLLQAVGLLFERSGAGRRCLRHRLAARCFTIAIVALPAPLLFHPPFVTGVFVPFMVAIGALPREV